MKNRIAVSAAAALALSAPAAAEPATVDPGLFTELQGPRAPRVIGDFEIDGAQLSLRARGRGASLDTRFAREALEEARAMKGVLPGYPQPALMTLELRVAF